MAAPVLVREYANLRPESTPSRLHTTKALPPLSSFAFADILRAADSPDLQLAIDGIAEICAKNHMSLANEHSSHLPPLGTITATTTDVARPQLLRPGMRRALTSVPEASSGSSEGSRKRLKSRSSLFGFKRQREEQSKNLRVIRIGSMGRTVSVTGIAALATTIDLPVRCGDVTTYSTADDVDSTAVTTTRRPSQAVTSLQRLLREHREDQHG